MDYSEILASVIAVIGVLMGIVLRYIFDNKKAKKKYNSEHNVDIRNEHKKVYAELIKAVTPLTSLSITPRKISSEQITVWYKNISYLYFKYYSCFPQVVLNEMNCLHLCLKSGGKKIYCVKKNNKILKCDKNDVIEIFGDTVHVGGEREKFEKIIEKYSLEDLKDSFKINLQARRVILVAESLRR